MNSTILFLISCFHRVLNVVRFLLGNSPASEFYIPTLPNTVPSSYVGRCLPMKMGQCSETSAYNIHTPGNYPAESIQEYNFTSLVLLTVMHGGYVTHDTDNTLHFVARLHIKHLYSSNIEHVCIKI
jgi:hypothetical protein